MSRLTLFCDASHCPSTGAGGWGAWAKRDGWQTGVFLGNSFKRLLANSSEAELCAIANALSHLQANDCFAGVAVLMIQSDSLRALGLLHTHVRGIMPAPHRDGCDVEKVGGKMSDYETEASVRVRGFTLETKISIYVRHVRGHKQGDGRQWVNRECDNLAREHMRYARERVLGGYFNDV